MTRKKKQDERPTIECPLRVKLSAKESLKRMQEFPKRKEQFIASVRKDLQERQRNTNRH